MQSDYICSIATNAPSTLHPASHPIDLLSDVELSDMYEERCLLTLRYTPRPSIY